MQALLGGDCARAIGPNVTVVSPENILNSGYAEYLLKPGQFALQQPFQRPNPVRQKGRHADGAGSKRAREDEAYASTASTPGDVKQQVPEHIQTITEAHQQLLHLLESSGTVPEQQSTQHAAARPVQRPYNPGVDVSVEVQASPVATLQLTEQQHPAAATSTQSQTTAQPSSHQHAGSADGGAAASAAPVDAAGAPTQTAEGGTEWLALAAMKHILKPKISFVHSAAKQINPKHQQQPQHQPHLSHAQQAARPQQKQQEQPHNHRHRQHQQQQTWNLFNTVVCNPSHVATVAAAYDQEVLLPARSSFCMSDLQAMKPFVQAVQDRGGASVLVIDPPWENASARRSATYSTLTPNHLLYLPVKQLIQQDPGTLVALWMTNRPRLHRFVQQQLLPAWGLKHAATWLWLKVTDAGEPVSPLDSLHRHPFEQVWLLRIQSGDLGALGSDTAAIEQNSLMQQGCQEQQQQQGCQGQQQQRHQEQQGQQQQQQEHKEHQEQLQGPLEQPEQQAEQIIPPSAEPTKSPATIAATTIDIQHDYHAQGDSVVKQPPDNHVLISVPGQHSRKPHLGQLLMPYVSQKHQHQHNKQLQGLDLRCVSDSHIRVPAAGAIDSQSQDGSVTPVEQDTGEEGALVCVELFARELFPGWMSWGNEVIKFQGMNYWTRKVVNGP